MDENIRRLKREALAGGALEARRYLRAVERALDRSFLCYATITFIRPDFLTAQIDGLDLEVSVALPFMLREHSGEYFGKITPSYVVGDKVLIAKPDNGTGCQYAPVWLDLNVDGRCRAMLE